MDAEAADREAGMSSVGDGSVGDWIGVDLKSPGHRQRQQQNLGQEQQHGQPP